MNYENYVLEKAPSIPINMAREFVLNSLKDISTLPIPSKNHDHFVALMKYSLDQRIELCTFLHGKKADERKEVRKITSYLEFKRKKKDIPLI